MSRPNEYHSQFGEDRVLERIFDGQETGVCVEVGAHDGVTGSTTLLFERKGWICVLVEPVPELCDKIRKVRSCMVFNCAASSEPGEETFFVAESDTSLSTFHMTPEQEARIAAVKSAVRTVRVRKRTLDDVLGEANVPRVDFITIDVEGHELSVLKGFSLTTFRPRILIVEDNSDQVDWSVLDYLDAHGYAHFHRSGVNDWYASKDDRTLCDPTSVRTRLEERRRTRFENRIKKRFAFLDRLLPGSTIGALNRILGFVSRRI